MPTMNLSFEDQHILIVDDSRTNCLLIQSMLEENNFKHISLASSAKEAYEILETQAIDAILLDVMMPVIDGIQACKTIRENSAYDTIPIIMVTASSDNDTFKQSFQAGADDFIPKPINEIVLISRLQSQLEKHEMHKVIIEQSRFSAMDEVISMLAHQWRQPLSVINAILNNARIKIELDSLDKNYIDDAFEKVELNLEKLSQMISDFQKSFTSNESKECLDLSHTVKDLLILHQEDINKLGIKIQADIDKIEPHIVAKRSLVQVIAHLMNNCFDSFIRFEIANPTISISLKEHNGSAIVTITDNGKGITQKDMPHIFEPYFSTKHEKNGKGLGLYFAKQLTLQQLQGTLTIVSHEEETTATATIKLYQLC